MTFRFHLLPPASIAEAPESPTEADYESIIIEACSVLAGTECRFEMSGFGQETWPVDVGYDLSAFVEQLPEAMKQLQCGRPADIDLYGQGLERALHIEVSDDVAHVRCVSRTSWQPAPEIEVVDRIELLEMFRSVALRFADGLDLIWPRDPVVAPARDKLRFVDRMA